MLVTCTVTGSHFTINGSDFKIHEHFRYQQCSINTLATNFSLVILVRIQCINNKNLSKKNIVWL